MTISYAFREAASSARARKIKQRALFHRYTVSKRRNLGQMDPYYLVLAPQPDFDMVLSLRQIWRDQVARDNLSIDSHFDHALADLHWIMDNDVEFTTSKYASRRESAPGGWDAGVDAQAIIFGADAEDPLGDGNIVPGCRAGQPRVFRLTVHGGVTSGNHLGIDVRLAFVDFADVFSC